MALQFSGRHFPKDVILTAVRWYLAYPLSYRHVEELLAERDILADHSTVQRWVVRYAPELAGQAKRRCRPKAIRLHGCPEKITIDGSQASNAALERLNAERRRAKLRPFMIRQVKYLNNIVEQDHRAIKRITQPMLGFKTFAAGTATLAGIELIHMIRKGQLKERYQQGNFAQQFEALAA